MHCLSLVVSLVCLADQASIEVFTDRDETYLRAGTNAGLTVGETVTLFADAAGRRRVGTAVVMEVWPALARINLDAAARADKTARKFALADESAKWAQLPRPAVAAPPPPPPPPAPAPPVAPPPPAPAARAPAASAPSPGSLPGHALFRGVGPWKVLSLYNDSPVGWTSCRLELPGRLVYTLAFLRAGDHEAIALSNFQGPEGEVPIDSVSVRCAEGSARFTFSAD